MADDVSTRVQVWNRLLVVMKSNINGKLVQDDALHKRLEQEMVEVYEKLTDEERKTVERIPMPLLRAERSLIAHNNKGQLIGFEDDEECYDSGGWCGD